MRSSAAAIRPAAGRSRAGHPEQSLTAFRTFPGLFAEHRLHLIPRHAIDDTCVMIFHVIFGRLAMIDDGTMREEIFRDRLLHFQIAHIFFVPKHRHDRAAGSVSAIHRPAPCPVQLLCNPFRGLSADIPFKKIPHGRFSSHSPAAYFPQARAAGCGWRKWDKNVADAPKVYPYIC